MGPDLIESEQRAEASEDGVGEATESCCEAMASARAMNGG